MWLLIDDVRDLNVDVIARTPSAAKDLLRKQDWEAVLFDHDLGTKETGYDILVWALENEYLPKHVQLVTSNPVGRQNMGRALQAHGYVPKMDYINYFRN